MARVEYTDWTVPVAQVGSRPGQTMELNKEFPAPSGIGDSYVGVTQGAPVQVDGRFDSIVDGLIFMGTLTAPMHAVCARCDDTIDEDLHCQVTAFFPYESGRLAEMNGGSRDGDGRDGRDGRGSKGRKSKKEQEVEIVAGEEESEDLYPLLDNGAFADMEALIRDTFVDALPLQPLCRPDCKGLCPQCGEDLNENPEHHHEKVDTRFAGLAALKAQLKAEE
ncbi:YceD family protein [Bifidobacterium gallicum]|uniref:Metal-binding protein n=1 Tax=Bifidobacterium gallicum DSM 20093 = LMG 11596 TaxID=561180 RepID=D1NUE0_9BIFI|nr:DUF177 domain-containing protein [Bifidobacterium gallicum]EFA23344.1 putative ACR, COG1399 [Bifidobacterium gallicum DSM 20093 = LMG 11596]KFI57895.1 metal-binding protein [Bifidobacterium gallicum DSM 20093 = LMG 11596]